VRVLGDRRAFVRNGSIATQLVGRCAALRHDSHTAPASLRRGGLFFKSTLFTGTVPT
jgi:hypothetical protein